MHVEIDWETLLVAFFVVSSVIATWGYRLRRLGREARSRKAMEKAVEANLHVPQSLHPVIDPDICIGSLSCITACPEGDILGVVDGRAVLINASACIGHGKCELECPVDAIKLVFGTSERGHDLPRVDECFESSRKGVYIVGELGGMGLIKNALVQGLQVGKHLKEAIAAVQSPRRNEVVDVAVVGAGAAGLATALACKDNKLSCRVLEQDTVGGTIAHYPRQKVVMTERVELPLVGKFGKKLISKEELLGAWKKIVEKAQLRVDQGVKVEDIQGEDNGFRIITNKGEVRARKVVLAIGRRGTPRKLAVPGEESAKVAYRLVDPEQYEGARVLVVGGGDSALEAAIQLAEQSDAHVTLSYRNAEFGRCREANKRKFADLVAKQHIHAVMSSNVMEIQEDTVILKTTKGLRQLPNDFVIACLGGELPSEFLKTLGVDMRRHFGTSIGDAPKTGEHARARRGSAKVEEQKRRQWRLGVALTIVGAVMIAVLSLIGGKYYLLPPPERLKSPLHAFLKPAGAWGHGLGIVATFFMMTNFLYVLRKRWSLLKGKGDIRTWMTFHQFFGLFGPLLVCYHAAFQSRNVLATATAVSVAIVVLTGLVGRFVHEMLPSTDGGDTGFKELVAKWERLKQRVEPMLDSIANASTLRVMLAQATSMVPQGAGTGAFVNANLDVRRARRELVKLRDLFTSSNQFDEFSDTMERLLRLRTQVSFYRRLRKFMSIWRIIHVVQSVLLVGMIAAHVAVSLYLGYRWLFS